MNKIKVAASVGQLAVAFFAAAQALGFIPATVDLNAILIATFAAISGSDKAKDAVSTKA